MSNPTPTPTPTPTPRKSHEGPMPGADRQAFMAKVREALGRMGPVRVPPPPKVDESLARLVGEDGDLLERFAQRAAATGMTVHRLTSADLIRQMLALLDSLGAKRVVIGAGTVPAALGVRDSIRRKGIEIVDWKATPGLESQYDVDAGITDVHAALAETGSLVCCSDAGHSRGLSLVPPVHIAIVRRSDILPDMIDLWARQRGIPGPELPSSMAVITGPSKTADIEGELIVGVHGPGKVHVLLVADA